jgi:Zn-dependent protease
MAIMMVSITRYWRNLSLAWLLPLLWALTGGFALAGSIEPQRAQLSAGEDGYALSADFVIDLGAQIEEAVTHGVTLNFNLEFTLSRRRWYWADEHVAGHVLRYRLAYNALTRQYRLSVGGLHQGFASLKEALGVLGHVGNLTVAERSAVKPGETYQAALRLSLDKSQLPKPFQLDAIASKEWQVDARVLRWEYVPGAETK